MAVSIEEIDYVSLNGVVNRFPGFDPHRDERLPSLLPYDEYTTVFSRVIAVDLVNLEFAFVMVTEKYSSTSLASLSSQDAGQRDRREEEAILHGRDMTTMFSGQRRDLHKAVHQRPAPVAPFSAERR